MIKARILSLIGFLLYMKKPSIEEILMQDIESLRNCEHELKCYNCPENICVKLISVADFPSKYGHFQILGFTNNKDGKDHFILLKGNIEDGEDILTRVHSSCVTGDALGSKRCDCGPQLRKSVRMIEQEGRGVLLYHQAEGRGMGLLNKLRALALQDDGLDTVEADEILGFDADRRDFNVPIAILKKMGIKSVRLITNNMEKVNAFVNNGIKVNSRVHIEISPDKVKEEYMKTKKEKLGHILSLTHKDL